MRQVILYSVLLFVGLGLSQVLPSILGNAYDSAAVAIRALTMVALAFIMIHVGFEFHIDKSKLGSYGWDYVVAFKAVKVFLRLHRRQLPHELTIAVYSGLIAYPLYSIET